MVRLIATNLIIKTLFCYSKDDADSINAILGKQMCWKDRLKLHDHMMINSLTGIFQHDKHA